MAVVIGLGVVGILLAILAVLLADRWRQDRIDRLRDQTRLKVIETQIAALRAALRISAAEQMARRRMQAEASDAFVHSTIDEKSKEWR